MKLTRETLQGMSTNERLYEANLMESFDEAVVKRDVNALKKILRSVYVDEESIQRIIKDILKPESS